MSDQEKQTTLTPQPDGEKKKESTKPAQGELADEELDKVAGGAPSVSEFAITKHTDQATN